MPDETSSQHNEGNDNQHLKSRGNESKRREKLSFKVKRIIFISYLKNLIVPARDYSKFGNTRFTEWSTSILNF